jgi:hypothetical protein
MADVTVQIEELIVDGAADEAAVAEAVRARTGDLLDAATLARVSRAVVAASGDGRADSTMLRTRAGVMARTPR